jgi:hypothetical protein
MNIIYNAYLIFVTLYCSNFIFLCRRRLWKKDERKKCATIQKKTTQMARIEFHGEEEKISVTLLFVYFMLIDSLLLD